MSGDPGGGSAGRGERNGRVGRWLGRLNRSDRVLSLLFAASFLETIVVPIPIELILIPFMLANPRRAWRTAGAVTLGIVPVPFQTAMLAAGTAEYPLPLFVLAATIARGIRYFGLALLVELFGERTILYWERNRWATVLAVAAAVAAVWLLVRWLGGRVL